MVAKSVLVVGSQAALAVPPRVMALVTTRGLSGFGSAMTTFALNVWAFRTTHSYFVFAILSMLWTLPNLLVLPFAGPLIDRGDKKRLLAACEAATFAAAAFVLARALSGGLDVTTVTVAVAILSTASAIRWALMGVIISLLVPREALGRVNGLQQSLAGASDVLAPSVGAALLQAIGMTTVVWVDLATTLIALFALSLIDSQMLRTCASGGREFLGFWRNAAFGWLWIARRPELRRLLLFVTGYNVAGAVFTVTFLPYLLSFASDGAAARALACEGAGAFVAGLLLTRRRAVGTAAAPERRVLACAFGFGLLLGAWGLLRSDGAGLLVGVSAGLLTSTLIASLQTVWQQHVPAEVQGRVFATRRAVSFVLVPIAMLASVPAAEYLFASALTWPALGASWGTGSVGALGLLLSTCGTVLAIACAWRAWRGGLDIIPYSQRLGPERPDGPLP